MIPELLPQQIFAIFMVFARVGGMMMAVPAFGEASVPVRVRLILSLLLSYILAAPLAARMPELPENPLVLFTILAPEIIIGVMMGMLIRMTFSALMTMGEIVAMTTSLSFAQSVNPMMGTGGSAISIFLSTLGLMMIFATDTHHLFLQGIADSYMLFPVGKYPSIGDASELALQIVSSCFALGVQLSAPFIVLSMMINIGLGLANRVMPQFQVFFISAPLSILMGFFVLSTTVGISLNIWIARVETTTRLFGGS